MPDNVLNRAIAPELQAFQAFTLREPETHQLAGVPVFVLEAGLQEVLRIDLVFAAGSWHEAQPLVSGLTNRMLQEGSRMRTGAALADFFDFYGAYLSYEATADRSGVSLYCLSHQAERLLPTLFELVFSPAFPANELATTVRNQKQQLSVEQEKVSFLARRALSEALFGSAHPYGRQSNEARYNALQPEWLEQFHRQYYTRQQLSISVSGRGVHAILPQLAELLGSVAPGSQLAEPRFEPSSSLGKVHIPKSDALQHALRLGRRIIDKRHADYHGLKVLNTLLGGYFGSRLMSNLREDKGFTYGVGSAVLSYERDAVWTIATEVGAHQSAAALDEIYGEMERLRRAPVGSEELERVRQYLQGVYMSSFDGAFALADRFRDVHHFGLDSSYYTQYLHTVQHITPEQLQALAQQYLNPADFVTIVAGG